MSYESNVAESTEYDVNEMASAIEALNTAEQARYDKARDITTKQVRLKKMESKAVKEMEADRKKKEFKSYISLGFEN